MMDQVKFRRTVAAFAEYVINLAVRELELEHRKEQNTLCCIPVSPRRVTFSPFVRIREIEKDEDEPVYIELHVFTTDQFTGTLHESSEMRPQWVETTNIPFDEMWPDDKYWFPMVLEGQTFLGYFLFEGHDKILKYTFDKVDTI